jgi:hypothetical protein
MHKINDDLTAAALALLKALIVLSWKVCNTFLIVIVLRWLIFYVL